MNKAITPGTRIELRNEEWLVRRVDLTASGGQQIGCIGLSELVKDKETVFLQRLIGIQNLAKA